MRIKSCDGNLINLIAIVVCFFTGSTLATSDSIRPGEFSLVRPPENITCTLHTAKFCNSRECRNIYEAVLMDNKDNEFAWTLRSNNLNLTDNLAKVDLCSINILVSNDLSTFTRKEEIFILKYFHLSKFVYRMGIRAILIHISSGPQFLNYRAYYRAPLTYFRHLYQTKNIKR